MLLANEVAEDGRENHETALGILENFHDENLISSYPSLTKVTPVVLNIRNPQIYRGYLGLLEHTMIGSKRKGSTYQHLTRGHNPEQR